MAKGQTRVHEEVKRTGRGFVALVRKNIRLILAVIAGFVFLALLEDVLEGEAMKLDAAAYSFFVLGMRSDAITPLMEAFTAIATPVSLLVIWMVAAAFAPGRRVGFAMVLNFVCTIGLNLLLKSLVQRPRPADIALVAETGYSFPSGHSMLAMAFFGFFVYLIWHYERDNLQKWVWSIAFSLIIVMMGVSRIYLGVHYASDVLAGFCVSILWLVLYTALICPLLLPTASELEAERREDTSEPS